MDIYDKVIEVFKKMLLLGVGFSLLIVGLAGLVLPFLPGIVLVFIGLTFCAKGSASIAKSEFVIKSLKFLGHKVHGTKDLIIKVLKNSISKKDLMPKHKIDKKLLSDKFRPKIIENK